MTYTNFQVLPISAAFVELRNLLGNYDKLPIPRGVCNQQVVGSNPTAGFPLRIPICRWDNIPKVLASWNITNSRYER
jgi:hypothetical protein